MSFEHLLQYLLCFHLLPLGTLELGYFVNMHLKPSRYIPLQLQHFFPYFKMCLYFWVIFLVCSVMLKKCLVIV